MPKRLPKLQIVHRRDPQLAVAGGNQSLAEALVTFRFLRNAAGEVPDAN